MKKLLFVILGFFIFELSFAQNLSPRQLLPGLFEDVQLSNMFPDNKTFVDATPKRDPKMIMKDYILQKKNTEFDLKKFVSDNFIIPGTISDEFKSNISGGVLKHIDTLWQVLYRRHDTVSRYSSLISLPKDFIVPGGRFRETYYWDSYFTMLGLHESQKTKIIHNMIDNFAFLIDKYGFIPNGTRTYYLTRSQPPFFSMMIDLLAKEEGVNVIVKYQPELLKEYQYWMEGATKLKPGQANRMVVSMTGGEILNRYWDDSDKPREESFKEDVNALKETKQKPEIFFRNIRAAAASGWDFSTRWFDESGKLSSIQTTSIIPVDLNCLLYNLELNIAKSYQLQKNNLKHNEYLTKALTRKKAIIKYNWSEKDAWFMDYNWVTKQKTQHQTLAGVFPLAFKISDTAQATKVALILKTKFLKSGGLLTTLQRSGQQWDSPNGWAPLQYMAIDGLNHYHKDSLAKEIALKWTNNNIRVFNNTGKLMEKYNVTDTEINAGGGEYPLQDGFGWTNGVLLYLINKYHFDPFVKP